MGHPRKSRKNYDTPSHPWNADRIKDENRLASRYGLKNKKEIWKAETKIRRYRRDARVLLGAESDQNQKEREQLLGSLIRNGIMAESAKLEDVLDLTVEDVLRRRLQTMVHKQGLAHTVKQARLMVVHGHIALEGRKINSPGYLVKRGEEEQIGFYPGSPMEQQIKKPAKQETGAKE